MNYGTQKIHFIRANRPRFENPETEKGTSLQETYADGQRNQRIFELCFGFA